MTTPLRERWAVMLDDGPDLHVQGNIADHEYAIESDGRRVAEVSKRWFRVRDTHGVEVSPGENDILVLATAAVLDTMAHPDRCRRQFGKQSALLLSTKLTCAFRAPSGGLSNWALARPLWARACWCLSPHWIARASAAACRALAWLIWLAARSASPRPFSASA